MEKLEKEFSGNYIQLPRNEKKPKKHFIFGIGLKEHTQFRIKDCKFYNCKLKLIIEKE